jgi:hypothetical protein
VPKRAVRRPPIANRANMTVPRQGKQVGQARAEFQAVR